MIKYEYHWLGQLMSVMDRFSNPFDMLYEQGIKQLFLWGNSPIILSLREMLAEKKLFVKVITQEVEKKKTVLGGSYKTLTLKQAAKIAIASDSAVVICDQGITKKNISELHVVFKSNIYYLDLLLRDAIVRYGFYNPLLNFIKKLKINISVFTIGTYSLKSMKEKTDYERLLLKGNITPEEKLVRTRIRREEVYKEYTDEQVAALASKGLKFYVYNNITYAIDYKSSVYNYHNNERFTTNVPHMTNNNIWFLGNSRSHGDGVVDSDTIQSKLQAIINDSVYNTEWTVHNIPRGGAYTTASYFPFIETLPLRDGDIICFMLTHNLSEYFELINVIDALQRPHDMGEIWLDKNHLNGRGNMAVAREIFEYLSNNKYLSKEKTNYPPENGGKLMNTDLWSYLESISCHKPQSGKVGSIVVNCNPFTLGHRYIIEYASKKVDRLFIFVVEEDRSVFPFNDRIELVRKGTADLGNVTVLSSGKFIISADTFAEYFEKAEKQDLIIDASNDLTIFGEYIAPSLGISVRFAGEEPHDKITRQYNEQMSNILPSYGVEFIVIPRKEASGEVISASTVRKLLDDNNFEKISKFVPLTTLRYLKDNWRSLADI